MIERRSDRHARRSRPQRLNDEDWDALDAAATELGTSGQGLIEEAVHYIIGKRKEPPRRKP